MYLCGSSNSPNVVPWFFFFFFFWVEKGISLNYKSIKSNKEAVSVSGQHLPEYPPVKS